MLSHPIHQASKHLAIIKDVYQRATAIQQFAEEREPIIGTLPQPLRDGLHLRLHLVVMVGDADILAMQFAIPIN